MHLFSCTLHKCAVLMELFILLKGQLNYLLTPLWVGNCYILGSSLLTIYICNKKKNYVINLFPSLKWKQVRIYKHILIFIVYSFLYKFGALDNLWVSYILATALQPTLVEISHVCTAGM